MSPSEFIGCCVTFASLVLQVPVLLPCAQPECHDALCPPIHWHGRHQKAKNQAFHAYLDCMPEQPSMVLSTVAQAFAADAEGQLGTTLWQRAGNCEGLAKISSTM